MGIKWTTKTNKFPEMKRNAAELNGKSVEVGVLGGGEESWLAGIHEYGCTITVTPKMRAYLHHHGLHLKASTMVIKIPERSFLRNGYDEKKEDVIASAEPVIGDVMSGAMSTNTFLEMVGETLASAIKEFAVDLTSPANHPFTTERKGSSNPLVDSGAMIGAINFRVK